MLPKCLLALWLIMLEVAGLLPTACSQCGDGGLGFRLLGQRPAGWSSINNSEQQQSNSTSLIGQSATDSASCSCQCLGAGTCVTWMFMAGVNTCWLFDSFAWVAPTEADPAAVLGRVTGIMKMPPECQLNSSSVPDSISFMPDVSKLLYLVTLVGEEATWQHCNLRCLSEPLCVCSSIQQMYPDEDTGAALLGCSLWTALSYNISSMATAIGARHFRYPTRSCADSTNSSYSILPTASMPAVPPVVVPTLEVSSVPPPSIQQVPVATVPVMPQPQSQESSALEFSLTSSSPQPPSPSPPTSPASNAITPSAPSPLILMPVTSPPPNVTAATTSPPSNVMSPATNVTATPTSPSSPTPSAAPTSIPPNTTTSVTAVNSSSAGRLPAASPSPMYVSASPAPVQGYAPAGISPQPASLRLASPPMPGANQTAAPAPADSTRRGAGGTSAALRAGGAQEARGSAARFNSFMPAAFVTLCSCLLWVLP